MGYFHPRELGRGLAVKGTGERPYSFQPLGSDRGQKKIFIIKVAEKGDRSVESESHLGPTLRLSPIDLQQSESSNKVIGCDHGGGG